MQALEDALATERQIEAFALAHARREAARNSGANFSGPGPTPFTHRTEAELLAAARDRMERRGAFEVSPAGRFLLSVSTIQAAAKTAGDLPLYSACSRALACCSRGLAGELDHAARCLAEVELCGGDVAEARAALADVEGAQVLQAAE
jgi:hypothetical protein